MKHWNLGEIWNGAFDNMESETIKAREYLHASELGNSFIEIYYKLRGEPYTNTFSVINRRKMEAGKLFEGIVRFVLKRAGILQKAQEKVDHQIKGCLATHGRLDFVAGGKIDIMQSEQCTTLIKILFDELEFPPIYQQIADNTLAMVQRLAGKKNESLHNYILELKSVSDFVYRLIEGATRPMNTHHLQNFHYLLGKDMPTGKVAYLNRDDVRLMEKKVDNDAKSFEEYKKWIEQMTDYHRSTTPPPKEPLILFHRDTCSFNKNTMGVEWCKYLKKIYGYATTEDFRTDIMPKVTSMNYVFGRCVNNSTMTADNLKVIKEATALFPEWEYYVNLGKLRKEKRIAIKGERV